MSRVVVMSIDIHQDQETYIKKKNLILYKECVLVYIIKNPKKLISKMTFNIVL